MKKELLFSVTKKDFTISYFSGKGAGGQHRNRHKNCVRISHKESGAMATGQSHRERRSNMKDALRRLVDSHKFKVWLNRKSWEIIEGKKLEDKVEEQMNPKNLKVEVREDDGWTEFVT